MPLRYWYAPWMTTLDAGRFTPVAIVVVQQMTWIEFSRKPRSTSVRASGWSPAWCQATPTAAQSASVLFICIDSPRFTVDESLRCTVGSSPVTLRMSCTSDASGAFVSVSAPGTRSLCDSALATSSH